MRGWVVAGMIVVAASTASAARMPAKRCAVAKLKAAMRATDAALRCAQKAAAAGDVLDPACATPAGDALTAAFRRAEAKGGCITTGDAAAVMASIVTWVTGLSHAVPPVPTTTSTSTSMTTTSSSTSTTFGIPCGGIFPVCIGSCPQGQTCSGFSPALPCSCM